MRNAIRTLIVDDSPDVRRLIRRELEMRCGIEVVGCAGDRQEAMEQADALNPALILMDLRMPKMNGLEATRLLRKVMPGLSIILITSDDTPELRLLCKASGHPR
jgi:DNA-binding NarL/FixJ family response regulator